MDDPEVDLYVPQVGQGEPAEEDGRHRHSHQRRLASPVNVVTALRLDGSWVRVHRSLCHISIVPGRAVPAATPPLGGPPCRRHLL